MKKITTERELPNGSVNKTADGESGDVLVLEEEEGWLFDNCCGRHISAAALWKTDGLFLHYRPEEVNQ